MGWMWSALLAASMAAWPPGPGLDRQQGFERMDRQLLDAAALAGHLVPAGSMFAFLAAHRAEVFPDPDYADLFSPPSLPAVAAGRRCRPRRWPR
jgi:hypothetical protein